MPFLLYPHKENSLLIFEFIRDQLRVARMRKQYRTICTDISKELTACFSVYENIRVVIDLFNNDKTITQVIVVYGIP